MGIKIKFDMGLDRKISCGRFFVEQKHSCGQLCLERTLTCGTMFLGTEFVRPQYHLQNMHGNLYLGADLFIEQPETVVRLTVGDDKLWLFNAGTVNDITLGSLDTSLLQELDNHSVDKPIAETYGKLILYAGASPLLTDSKGVYFKTIDGDYLAVEE